MKKIIRSICSVMIAMVMALSMSISVYAESVNGMWYIGQVDDDEHPRFFGRTGQGTVSVDDKVYYTGSRCSLKLQNNDYDYSLAEKELTLEPNTTYKFSAKVKYKNYKKDPNAGKNSGAYLSVCSFEGTSFVLTASSDYSTAEDWTELSLTFTTKAEEKDYYIRLFNGDYQYRCQGTAWFSDIKLEKAELKNNWNVLVLIFKNVDADLELHGKNTALKPSGKGLTNYKASFDEKDIKKIKSITDRLKTTMGEMSNGLVTIDNIDYKVVNSPVTKLTDDRLGGYCLDAYSGFVKKKIDKYTEDYKYNQVICFAPLDKVASKWIGKGAGSEMGICQITYSKTGFFDHPINKDFIEAPLVHEILHGVNSRSNTFDPDTPLLHSNDDIYKKAYSKYNDDNYKYYCDYMTRNLPDGRGIDPRAFYRPSDIFTLVDSNMSAGGLITMSDAFPINISDVKIAKTEDQTYTGKKIRPDVVLTDGKYTLKKGVDYSLSYKNNEEVGTATAIITGMGLYSGTAQTKFNIVKAAATGEPPTLTMTKKDGVIKISWSKVEGAGQYYVWVSRNGGKFEKIKELDASKKSYSLKAKKGTTYRFAVTAYIPELKKYTPYVYTDKI